MDPFTSPVTIATGNPSSHTPNSSVYYCSLNCFSLSTQHYQLCRANLDISKSKILPMEAGIVRLLLGALQERELAMDNSLVTTETDENIFYFRPSYTSKAVTVY
jgi:hypothetical protein